MYKNEKLIKNLQKANINVFLYAKIVETWLYIYEMRERYLCMQCNERMREYLGIE